MGTRADFYVNRGVEAEWLGSIAWDGYPDGIPDNILRAASEQEYRTAVENFLQSRNDATLPQNGWPWPWEDSCLTDYAYAFDGKVYAACFGSCWFVATEDEPEYDRTISKECVFPDMSARKNVTFGRRSGLIVVAKR